MKNGDTIEFIRGDHFGEKGKLEGVHSNGSCQVRIAGGRLISAAKEDIREEYIEEEEEEEKPITPKRHWNITLILGAVAMLIIIVLSFVGRNKPIDVLTNRLNELNTLDIPDLTSCYNLEKRRVEKETILKEIKYYKENGEFLK